jgi:uncharacterized protein YbbC (DUF1343 family)/CubicO group peptidase (beta-lactamase class C family)
MPSLFRHSGRLPAAAAAVVLASAMSASFLATTAVRAQLPPEGTVASRLAPVVNHARLGLIDTLVEQAIEEKKLPGAVVVVGHREAIVYEKAFGARAVVPSVEPMTLDTVFDAASLTKVVATTTAVMMLVEQGKIRLTDRVASFIPEFARYGKGDVTIRQLMTHTSGLRPDVDLADQWVGYDTAIRLATEEVLVAPPDTRFVYSDIGYFLLGDIVGRVGGMPLDRYVRERIFLPLRMEDSMFLPPESLRARIAPTKLCTPFGWPCDGPGAAMLRGVVHDPTTRRMAGVSGHAGLFTTAADLTRFARMLLGRGALDGLRLLSPLTVERMTTPATPPGERHVRGLGWDIDSSFSVNRGELFPFGSFGHTGFTGTSIWIDPASQTFVIFLSSRLHPDGKGDVSALRAKVSTVAASAVASVPEVRARGFGGLQWAPTGTIAVPAPRAAPRTTAGVMTGIDVLRAEGFARLKGRRVGLVTNHTGRARDGATTIDLLFGAKELTLVALFSPEHGIRGILDEKVPSSVDERTGLTIHSLYGETRRPTGEMLAGIDTMVIDLQDIGARFYTYMTTMAYVMEEAAGRGIAVVVLDRPNPINGWQIEGPMLDEEFVGFTGYLSMPTRHGMTLGELARLFNEEMTIGCDLTVVGMQGWSREDWFDATGLPWVNPSPNMRNLIQATLYPGIGSVEWANLSVGRGTDSPFEQIGAPWVDGTRLAAALNARALPGITFYPVLFTPGSSKFKDEECGGIFMIVTDRQALRPVRLGFEIVAALSRLHPGALDLGRTERLAGSRAGLQRAVSGDDPADIAAQWSAGEARWRLLRAKHLLY